jgi:hypothetical protein
LQDTFSKSEKRQIWTHFSRSHFIYEYFKLFEKKVVSDLVQGKPFHPNHYSLAGFFAMQCFARDGFHHDIPEIKTNLIKFISPKTTILIASANLIIFLLTKKCYNIPR